jgi:hypothetical protein
VKSSQARNDDSYTEDGARASQRTTISRHGLPWLESYDPETGPLFYMFDTNLPHPPFYWEEQWQDQFKPEDMILPSSYYEETFEGKPDFQGTRMLNGPHKLESEEQAP